MGVWKVSLSRFQYFSCKVDIPYVSVPLDLPGSHVPVRKIVLVSVNIDKQRMKLGSFHTRETCACVPICVHDISQSAILQATDASRTTSGAKRCQEINFRLLQKDVLRMRRSEIEPWVSRSQCACSTSFHFSHEKKGEICQTVYGSFTSL